jgi:MYXO-CTERM domain-containing protein
VSFVVTADFSISASPTTISVMRGSAGMITLAIAATGSAADTVTLSASGLPGGVTAAFMPPAVTAGSTVILTLTTGGTTPEGRYPITVTGIGTAAMHTAPVTLDVTATPSQGGGCGCDVDPGANAMNGGLFAIVLGFIARRRRRSS